MRGELGRRRALQGLPVDALLRAYYVGYREIWRKLVEAVPPDEVTTTRLMLEAAGILWGWTQRITNVLVETYGEVQRSKEAELTALQMRFLALVMSGEVESEECLALARTFGLPVAGRFHAIKVDSGAALPSLPVDSAARSRAPVTVRQGTGFLLLCEGERDEERERRLAASAPRAAIGVGMARPGLDGLRLSIIDAERAAAVAPPGELVAFEDRWVEATLAAASDRLEPLLERVTAAAARSPRLADAVLAFAASGFSLTAAGRALGIDPNTLAYRLDRWEQLTGLDPRGYEGLVRSVLGLRLGREAPARPG
jgi:hypothetical protein